VEANGIQSLLKICISGEFSELAEQVNNKIKPNFDFV